jgi:hypothetical protein
VMLAFELGLDRARLQSIGGGDCARDAAHGNNLTDTEPRRAFPRGRDP